MAGRFEGLSDLEWRLCKDVFPPAPQKRGRGMPHAPFRKLLNTLLYVLITGCRWCDVPRGPQWARRHQSPCRAEKARLVLSRRHCRG
jgi:transposase